MEISTAMQPTGLRTQSPACMLTDKFVTLDTVNKDLGICFFLVLLLPISKISCQYAVCHAHLIYFRKLIVLLRYIVMCHIWNYHCHYWLIYEVSMIYETYSSHSIILSNNVAIVVLLPKYKNWNENKQNPQYMNGKFSRSHYQKNT